MLMGITKTLDRLIMEKDFNKDKLLARQREMNSYFLKYQELIKSGKEAEAAVYYKKTLETARLLVQNGQKIIENILDSQKKQLEAKNATSEYKAMLIRDIDEKVIN